MELRLRRLLPRQFTDWHGRYMIEGDPDGIWRRCRVVDVSTLGAGLELFDTTPDELAEQRIILSVDLRGEVKHAVAATSDGTRVGIKFEDLSEAESAYVQSLVRLQALW
ncbi:MAG TPA: hypothetical protein VN816_07130 [Acidimicrobiales bacterium]|nr:hypothetical protein [Acidimicrobiales bacterium]